MFGDSKPRQFDYLYCKDNMTLQIKGNMKRKVPPQYERYLRQPITFGIKQNDKLKFIQQVNKNYEDLKSIVPADLKVNKRNEKIRTFKKQNYIGMSGVPYLALKSNVGRDHAEKKHVADLSESRKIEDCEYVRSQKKHYHSKQRQSSQELKNTRKHPQSLYQRISNDLYSSYNRQDRKNSCDIRRNYQDRNLFTEGVSLGYENNRERVLSKAKKQQLAGSYYRPNSAQSLNKRDDWRKSSIVFG